MKFLKDLASRAYLRFFFPALILFLQLCPNAYPAPVFDLSYSLTEGGYRLQLDNANLFKGIRLAVNTDAGCRYEIVQRLIQPLTSRDRPGFYIRDNLVMRAQRGSNKFGNLRIPSGDTQVRTDEVLYVSDPAGDADTFTYFLGIQRIEDIPPGLYSGRISLTLNPISSSLASVTKVIEIEVNVRTGDNRPFIEISSASGSKSIFLEPGRRDLKSGQVVVKIKGDLGRPFRILQSLARPAESEDGTRLTQGVLQYFVSGASKGSASSRQTEVSSAPQEIYRSQPDGRSDWLFSIDYIAADILGQKAGRYRSRIQYVLEVEGAQSRLETIDLELQIERVFELVITPQDQRYYINFPDLKPTQPPKQSVLLVEIKSNIGRPYQVSQDISMELTNKEGKSIPFSYFTMRTESLDSKGGVRLAGKQEVKKGHTILFVSDPKGSADRFRLIYELACPKEAPAGDYSANATFSLLEM